MSNRTSLKQQLQCHRRRYISHTPSAESIMYTSAQTLVMTDSKHIQYYHPYRISSMLLQLATPEGAAALWQLSCRPAYDFPENIFMSLSVTNWCPGGSIST